MSRLRYFEIDRGARKSGPYWLGRWTDDFSVFESFSLAKPAWQPSQGLHEVWIGELTADEITEEEALEMQSLILEEARENRFGA